MIDVVSQLEQQIGISIENLVLIVTALSAVIFSAKDMRLGLVFALLMFASEFVAFYQIGWEYFYAFVAFIMALVLFIMSLFMTYAKGREVV